MKVWYLSEQRFKNRIIKRWEKKGFKYNAGHVQLLSYSYRTLVLFSNQKKNKISNKNKYIAIDIEYPELF
jgi:hypothetical protein